MNQKMPFSICICTYNRCAELDKTLDSLLNAANALMPGDEILVIDNNSSDSTKEVVDRYHSKLPIKYYFEANQGLSSARNRGIDEFSTELIVYFDDDVTISCACLETYRQAFVAFGNGHYFGGKIEVDWQGAKPNWLQSNDLTLLNGLFGQYVLSEGSQTYTNNTLGPYGANFALGRSLIDKVGRFDLSLGVNGESIGRGEETDYFSRAQKKKLSGQYLPDAMVKHRFQRERLAVRYLFKYGIAKALEARQCSQSNRLKLLFSMVSFTVRGFWQLMQGRVDRFYQCVINIGIQYGLLMQHKTEQENYRSTGLE